LAVSLAYPSGRRGIISWFKRFLPAFATNRVEEGWGGRHPRSRKFFAIKKPLRDVTAEIEFFFFKKLEQDVSRKNKIQVKIV
jgi:hypothetical protein